MSNRCGGGLIIYVAGTNAARADEFWSGGNAVWVVFWPTGTMSSMAYGSQIRMADNLDIW